MAEPKKEEKAKPTGIGQNQLSEVVDKANELLLKELSTRPYLVVVATGFEMGRDGEKTILAAQWSWRSNVIAGSEDGEKMADFLAGQLREAVEQPEKGVKKFYRKK